MTTSDHLAAITTCTQAWTECYKAAFRLAGDTPFPEKPVPVDVPCITCGTPNPSNSRGCSNLDCRWCEEVVC
jgi:hypothetical protein